MASNSTDAKYPSEDNDSGYKVLAQMQEQICKVNPTHSCTISLDDCKKIFKSEALAYLRTSGNNTGISDDELISIIVDVCNHRSTPYEFPGTHFILKTRLEVIHNVARTLGYNLPTNICYSTINISSVNAEVSTVTQTGQPIILVNTRLLEFAHQLSVIAAETIPIKEVSEKSWVINADESASRSYMDEHTELQARLIGVLLHFLGLQNGMNEIVTTPFSIAIATPYNEGIVLFVLAHEIGHIYFKHPTSSFNIDKYFPELLNNFTTEDSYLTLPMRELKADLFALSILIQHRNNIIKEDKANLSRQAVIHAAKFFFISQMIMDEAKELAGIESAPVLPYDNILANNVEMFALCSLRNNCNFSDMPELFFYLKSKNLYPPHRMRSDIVQKAINFHNEEVDATASSLGETMNRNIQILWEQTREIFASQLKKQ